MNYRKIINILDKPSVYKLEDDIKKVLDKNLVQYNSKLDEATGSIKKYGRGLIRAFLKLSRER